MTRSACIYCGAIVDRRTRYGLETRTGLRVHCRCANALIIDLATALLNNTPPNPSPIFRRYKKNP